MRKTFIVDVPCTVTDRYFVFADSEADARRKMNTGSMTEDSTAMPGDYTHRGTTEHDPETHWDRAVILGEAKQ
jgi:hypothetical protein